MKLIPYQLRWPIPNPVGSSIKSDKNFLSKKELWFFQINWVKKDHYLDISQQRKALLSKEKYFQPVQD